jgi:two-component system chemotaxis response regulator CheY
MKRVLVCDDANFMRKTLSDTLKRLGYEICGEAENGERAVQEYKRLKPDIVTMDITMPEKDGLQACKEINEFDKNAYVIMVSAMGQKPMILDAIKNGAKDFIVKPFQEEKILATLKRVG